MVNELKGAATTVENLPDVSVSRDPWDNYLLEMIEAAKAGYLITGDKADLLSLERHAGAQIVTVRHFLKLITGNEPGI